MNSILSYLAAFVLLVLAAVFIVPYAIDANTLRPLLERQASEATGSPVRIAGDIDMRLLPMPALSASEVSLGAAPGATAEIDAIDASLALTPLLRGDITIKGIRIVRPVVVVPRAPLDGGFEDLRALAPNVIAGLQETGEDAARIRFDDVLIEDGTVAIAGGDGMPRHSITGLNGILSADTMGGPFSVDLTAVFGGEPVRLAVKSAPVTASTPLRLRADLGVPERDLTAVFAGILTGSGEERAVDGTLRLVSDGAGDEGAVLAEAGTVATTTGAALRELKISFGAQSLTGSAELGWEGMPSAEIALEAVALDATPLIRQEEAPHAPAALFFEAAEWAVWQAASDALDLDARIEAGALSFGERALRNVLVVLENGTGEGLALSAADGDLGGGGSISVSGRFAADEEPAFQGRAALRSTDPEEDWGLAKKILFGGGPAPEWTGHLDTAFSRMTTFDYEGGLKAASSSLALEGSVAHRDEAELKGDLAVDWSGDRALLTARIEADAFDLERLRDSGGEEEMSWWQRARTIDGDVRLEAASLSAGAVGGGPGLVDALWTGESLALRALRLTDPHGGAITGSGEIAVEEAATRGAIELSAEASSPASLSPFLNTSAGEERLATLLPLTASATLSTGPASGPGAGVRTVLEAGGKAGVLAFSTAGRTQARPFDWEESASLLSVTAETEDATALEPLLGVKPPEGRGVVSARYEGVPAGDGTLLFTAGLSDDRFRYEGSLNQPLGERQMRGEVEATLADLGRYSRNDHAYDADPVPLAIKASLAVSPGAYALNGVTGTLMEAPITGRLTLEEGTPTRFKGRIEAEALTLDPLAIVAGRLRPERSAPADAAEDDLPWPAEPLDWGWFADWSGALQFKAGRIEWAGIVLEGASGVVSAEEGVLSLAPLTGRLFGGSLDAAARFEGGAAEPGLGLSLTLRDASLAAAAALAGAEPFMDGRGGFAVEFSGSGRSALDIVNALGGEGSVTVSDSTVQGFDIEEAAAALEALGDPALFEEAMAPTLASGTTGLDAFSGAFRVENGAAAMKVSGVSMDGGSGTLDAVLSLPRRAVGLDLAITLEGFEEAPPLKRIVRGLLRAPEAFWDMSDLERFVGAQLISRELSELEDGAAEDLIDLIEPSARSEEEGGAGSGAAAAPPLPMMRPAL